MDYHIGVDGGGTTTRAVVIDGESRVVMSRAQSGSSNLYNLGLDGAARNIALAVEGALSEAGVDLSQIATLGFGLAGVVSQTEKELWKNALQSLYGARVTVDEDVAAALVGAFGPDELRRGCAVLIAGTGANCFGQNAKGARARADGWGPMLGDRGSGFWLGESAIRAAVAAFDGASAPTILTSALLAHFEATSLGALCEIVYARDFGRERIAAFVPRVLEAARAGDEIAAQLLVESGAQLGRTARAVLTELSVTQLALTGGLLENSPEVRASLAELLGPSVELVTPRFEAVVGAALLPFSS